MGKENNSEMHAGLLIFQETILIGQMYDNFHIHHNHNPVGVRVPVGMGVGVGEQNELTS